MKLIFELGGEFVFVKIHGMNVSFATSATNYQQYVPFSFLKSSKEGILKEFPDLKDLSEEEIRQEANKRFQEHINNLGGEEEIKKYIIKEFTKRMGYVLKSVQKEGRYE